MQPIHAVEIDGRPLRYFCSPVWQETGTPDHPWHCWDDLCIVARVPAEWRIAYQRGLKADWGGETRTIATSDGAIVTVAQHYMAQGLFGALRYHSKILPTKDRHRIQDRYLDGQCKALGVMTAHMSQMEKLCFVMAGWK